nr:hypothetical protein [Chamaesiphon sp. VAR_48_metabat_135_sub]
MTIHHQCQLRPQNWHWWYIQQSCQFPPTRAGASDRAGFLLAPVIGPIQAASRATVRPIAIGIAARGTFLMECGRSRLYPVTVFKKI